MCVTVLERCSQSCHIQLMVGFFWLMVWFNFLLCHLDSLGSVSNQSWVFLSSGSKESDSSIWDPCHVQTIWALHTDSGCQTYTLPTVSWVWDSLLRCQTGKLNLRNPCLPNVWCLLLLRFINHWKHRRHRFETLLVWNLHILIDLLQLNVVVYFHEDADEVCVIVSDSQWILKS